MIPNTTSALLRAAVCLMLLPGCATMFASGPDMVPVNSTPPGARVLLDGTPVGATPCVVPIPRKSEGVIRLEMEGYEPVDVDREKTLNGWFLANIPLFIGILGPIGVIVDLATSNQGKYGTDPIDMPLRSVSPARSGDGANAASGVRTPSLQP